MPNVASRFKHPPHFRHFKYAHPSTAQGATVVTSVTALSSHILTQGEKTCHAPPFTPLPQTAQTYLRSVPLR